MFSKPLLAFVVLSVAFGSEPVSARVRWLERDDKHVTLYPRRFGEEHPAVLDKLAQACGNGVCATLAGGAISTLLAASPECAQQDFADKIIDTSRQFDATTQSNMIELAKEFRQAEKNTPPDFSVSPNILRNSVFCQTAPKNTELNGLVQAQDPANDPNTFFDPATKASVKKGAQANTFPFGTAGSASSSNSSSTAVTTSAAAAPAATLAVDSTSTDCVTAVTVTVTQTSATVNAASSTDCAPDVTVTVTQTSAAAAATTNAAASTSTSSDIGNFGSCSVPQIEFGVGFDNRKETSFEPVDKTSFNHGSAQNINIISQFICDTLTNSCKADATAKATCAKAQAAAAAAGTAKTGGQADAFNAAFGIKTDFAAIASVDDQGNVIAGTGSGSSAAATTAAAASATAAAPAAATTAASAASSSGIGNFGSCSVPQIEFGVGFDNRKETSFEPVDKTSFNHGSAQNINIITQFICDTLTNSCKADATAKATCAKAQAAASAGTAKTGGQADAFNAAFGIKTDFAAIASVDDQGNVIAGTGSGSSAAAATTAAAASAAPAAATTAASAASSSGIGNFGSCSVPQIEFGVGFDNRKETSFEPVDKTSFNHGSAQNINIITQFICDTLTNSCKADATAKATCAKAQAAAAAGTAKTGGQADAFNAAFGIKTDFAAIASVDDQGNVIAGTGSGSAAAATTAAAATSTTAAAAITTTATTAAAAATSASAATGSNLQKFTGTLGGITAPPVVALGGGAFQVTGNASFNNLGNALTRSCDVQHNQCANAANASGNKGDLTVEACGTQQTQCNQSNSV